jgi:hypothetical protein
MLSPKAIVIPEANVVGSPTPHLPQSKDRYRAEEQPVFFSQTTSDHNEQGEQMYAQKHQLLCLG